jgi:DNA modification methylase
LEVMKIIPDKSIDMILCDLPYKMTSGKWDILIPFDKLWEYYDKIIKDDGIICLFGTQPFTTDIINSNRNKFRYCWYWEKSSRPNGFVHAKNKPLTKIEEVCIFSKYKYGHESQVENRMRYYPQNVKSIGIKKVGPKGEMLGKRPNQDGKLYEAFENYPNNVLLYSHDEPSVHPTQKPVELCQYLIKTYTKENETVLDNCSGSGTTGVACKYINRKCMLIEKDEKYFQMGVDRIRNPEKQLKKIETKFSLFE